MREQKEKPFKSKLFRKLFVSYALLIALLVVGYCLWYWYAYSDHYRTVAREKIQQQEQTIRQQQAQITELNKRIAQMEDTISKAAAILGRERK